MSPIKGVQRKHHTNLVVYKENDDSWTVRNSGSSVFRTGLTWDQVHQAMAEVYEQAESEHKARMEAFSAPARAPSINLSELFTFMEKPNEKSPS